jgi:hypothetical protein
MSLRNGQNVSLSDEGTGYMGTQSQTGAIVGGISQQGAAQTGLVAEREGLLSSVYPQQTPHFVQPIAPPQGVMDGFVKTCQRWGLTEAQELLLLGYGDNKFLGLQLLNGRWLRPSQDVKDRVGYVVGISIGLGAIFNDVLEAEVRWLNTAHPRLGSKAPLDYMLGGRMRALMIVSNLVEEERAL